ncbi:hypothetical protein C6Y14_43270 [Streptomyces dioscori]|uniref:Uncharacterized protein n=1 Tax=Streptomyces dioscori TaxID=2109333 RepID=A0A2P8PTG0_9ACTN|nr:hypothetical protein C6Y14_43270 [Streptomyces dioscori]
MQAWTDRLRQIADRARARRADSLLAVGADGQQPSAGVLAGTGPTSAGNSTDEGGLVQAHGARRRTGLRTW